MKMLQILMNPQLQEKRNEEEKKVKKILMTQI